MRAIRAAAAAILSVSLFSGGAIGQPTAPPAAPQHPQVEVRTNAGSFVIELWPEAAPRSVNNFLFYVRTGFYEGTIFHRVIKNFVIQGGSVTADLKGKQTRRPVPLEKNAKNARWTVALARSDDPDSATSGFFINMTDNRSLDEAGYAVFGKVVEGTSVVEQIARVPVRRVRQGLEHLPVTDVVIESVTLRAPPPSPPVDTAGEEAGAPESAESAPGTVPAPAESPGASGGGR